MAGSPTEQDETPVFPDEIPVDENANSCDAYYADNANSAFTMASTVHDFSYEHGRRYQAYRYGSHPFPHDDLSVKNDRILHHMLLYLFDNRHFLAPVQDPKFILDVKCNQGLWAEDMADAYPDAQVVAMDTTPIPRSTYPNLSFLVQSVNDEWILDVPDMKFDFVYARNVFATTGDFGSLYKQAFDNMAPGAYFEQVEIEIIPRCDDSSIDPDSVIKRFADLTPQMSSAFGTEYNIAITMKDLLLQSGFVDLHETRLKVPLGPWSADLKYKQIGEWFEAFFKSGLQGWVLAPLTRKMNMTPELVNEWCEAAFQEVDSRKQHIYFIFSIVHCRKPV